MASVPRKWITPVSDDTQCEKSVDDENNLELVLVCDRDRLFVGPLLMTAFLFGQSKTSGPKARRPSAYLSSQMTSMGPTA